MANTKVPKSLRNTLNSHTKNGVENDNPIQYSCLGNSIDRGTWRATVHVVTKSWAWLSDWAHTYWKKKKKEQWAVTLVERNTLFLVGIRYKMWVKLSRKTGSLRCRDGAGGRSREQGRDWLPTSWPQSVCKFKKIRSCYMLIVVDL